MAKSREQKAKALEGIKEKIDMAKSVVFANYKGMKVGDMEELRKSIREKGGKFEVTKIRLAKLAFDSEEVEKLADKSSFAVAYSIEDEISIPKAVKKAANIEILGGFYEGSFVSKEEMEKLADLPSKEELIAKLMMVVKNPGNNLAGALDNFGQRLVGVIRAIDSK